jgi:hypothetical protein
LYFNHKITIKSTKILRGDGGHFGDIKHSFTSDCMKEGISDFRVHASRHTYASHLAMRGVHIRALQELVRWDALKKLNILLDELITILMNNSLSSLYGKANPRRAHSAANAVKAKADDAFGVIFLL